MYTLFIQLYYTTLWGLPPMVQITANGKEVQVDIHERQCPCPCQSPHQGVLGKQRCQVESPHVLALILSRSQPNWELLESPEEVWINQNIVKSQHYLTWIVSKFRYAWYKQIHHFCLNYAFQRAVQGQQAVQLIWWLVGSHKGSSSLYWLSWGSKPHPVHGPLAGRCSHQLWRPHKTECSLTYQNETIGHCHFSFFLKYMCHCWPMPSLTSCLRDPNPTSITLKVALPNSTWVPRNSWFTYLPVKMRCTVHHQLIGQIAHEARILKSLCLPQNNGHFNLLNCSAFFHCSARTYAEDGT